ncbi:hypothetical protein [Nonomuraea endophytica]|uniref:Uncharacterized protein n=1 Tax=Nonomuraea endophytica TaxID=714136 RepID=A0A7W8EDH3_9ACTN|nr:hypothetical protein [Nonomuraea endophytica]MBB5075398.1 hypothetical protein [Nonomuraea endophytica]
MSEVPHHVIELAEQRVKARAERDYALADELRARIEHEGWLVKDAPDGYTLSEKPPYTIWPTVRSIPITGATDAGPPRHLNPRAVGPTSGTGRDTTGGGEGSAGGTAGGAGAQQDPAAELGFSGDPQSSGAPEDDMLHAQRIWDASLAANRLDDAGVNQQRQRAEIADVTVSVGLIADGRPDDVRACVEALLEHTDAAVLALDLGNRDGVGDVLHEFATRRPERVTVWHVAELPHWFWGSAGWGACRTTLLRLDTSDVHVLMETSTILTGDALTPLTAAIQRGAVAAGWKGADPDADGHTWYEAGPGRVRALMGYLMAVRRAEALAAMPQEARYYRNADLELSLGLDGELVVPQETLPVHGLRHHGYHDVDEDYRERESRRTYDRVLRLLRPS